MADTLTTGLTCYGYYMSSGSWASPTWSLIPGIKDLKFNNQLKTIQANSRDDTHDAVLPGRFTKSVSFSVLRNKAATVQAALRTNHAAKTKTIFAFSDGPIATTGSTYWKMECYITSQNESEPEEGVTTTDYELMKAADSVNAPTQVTT